MDGDPQFVILEKTAWLDAAKFEKTILGSIVRLPLRPTTDHVPSRPLDYNEHDLVEPPTPFADFTLENTDISVKQASAKLLSLANLRFAGEINESVKLAGKVITFKKLQQISDFWASLLKDPAVKSKVPEWVERGGRHPPCLVVGIMIAEDVDIDTTRAPQRERGAGIELPIDTIAGAVTSAPIPSTIGNLGAEANEKQGSTSAFKARAGSSNIFALELQTIEISDKWYQRGRKLVLNDDGPKFDKGRLLGDEPAEEVANSSPTTDDLVLGGELVV